MKNGYWSFFLNYIFLLSLTTHKQSNKQNNSLYINKLYKIYTKKKIKNIIQVTAIVRRTALLTKMPFSNQLQVIHKVTEIRLLCYNNDDSYRFYKF